MTHEGAIIPPGTAAGVTRDIPDGDSRTVTHPRDIDYGLP